MAAAAVARHDESTAETAVETAPQQVPAASAEVPPAAASAGSRRRKLTREQWLKRELEAEQLQRRANEHSKKRVAKLASGTHVFGPRREEDLLRARQAVRARTMEARSAKVREYLRDLQCNAATAHLVIGFKRICDARKWSPVDIAARRMLALLLFLREVAIPHAWNTRYVRPQVRRGSRRLAEPSKLAGHFGTTRKYTPCARAIDQRAQLTQVLAGDGHSAEDDRRCSVKTVQRALRALEGVSLIQSVQVPPSAAEDWELGKRNPVTGEQHAFNRYYVADPGSPKPALMGVWTVDDTCGLDVLERPWAGMTPRPATDPPPIEA